jgi:hypothetical protein
MMMSGAASATLSSLKFTSKAASSTIALTASAGLLRRSVYLLYWYKSTNTDAEAGGASCIIVRSASAGLLSRACFTCFTGKKVRIRTQKLEEPRAP